MPLGLPLGDCVLCVSLAFTVVQESILPVLVVFSNFFVCYLLCHSLDSGAGAEGGSRVYKAVVLINRGPTSSSFQHNRLVVHSRPHNHPAVHRLDILSNSRLQSQQPAS